MPGSAWLTAKPFFLGAAMFVQKVYGQANLICPARYVSYRGYCCRLDPFATQEFVLALAKCCS